MRRVSFGIAVALVGTTLALFAGCAGSDPDAAKTPANAPTITNGQPPTDTGGDTASGGGGGGDDTAAVAAGKTFFEGTCQSCHPAGGTQQGVGPVLAGKGLGEDRISNQIVNGGVAMPPGLASGADLENVTKFVLSLQ
jgi:mono/diheme cytochrome c family protein